MINRRQDCRGGAREQVKKLQLSSFNCAGKNKT